MSIFGDKEPKYLEEISGKLGAIQQEEPDELRQCSLSLLIEYPTDCDSIPLRLLVLERVVQRLSVSPIVFL